jgi:hypothetical protein
LGGKLAHGGWLTLLTWMAAGGGGRSTKAKTARDSGGIVQIGIVSPDFSHGFWCTDCRPVMSRARVGDKDNTLLLCYD